MPSFHRPVFSLLLTSALLAPASSAFDAPLSPEAVRDAYFLGQHNDQSTFSFFSKYIRTLSAPDKGPYIAEVEFYTPYTQVVEASRRRTGSYSAQQGELDYRHHQDNLYASARPAGIHLLLIAYHHSFLVPLPLQFLSPILLNDFPVDSNSYDSFT